MGLRIYNFDWIGIEEKEDLLPFECLCTVCPKQLGLNEFDRKHLGQPYN